MDNWHATLNPNLILKDNLDIFSRSHITLPLELVSAFDLAHYGPRIARMSSLKQFIRNVRASKTIADERAVVQKESAAIRASFREESGDSNVRRNNVAKLLYLFTLGERTHFGQIECLKLLASPRFADKRLGYLGTMLLLDENQEVLTLVTNSLKNDLNHSNQYIAGLALVTLGNIASVEMSRDLFPEIETLLSTANPYIRRKAALCAMRICRKVPDLQEHFYEKAATLLSDRNHGVLLCGLTLVTSLCEADEAEGGEEGIVEKFRPFVGGLVRTLKGLASSGSAPEHDVTGVTDPFLQVKILQLLRVLGRGDAETSEQINDILAQVATNTDSSKNVGNSILYEAVLTILDIEADSGLRVLGVNILGKFLSNRDNNIRYVALNTLIKVVAIEPNAVQRHRNTILECLRDPDISIRRRALDLSFTLINEGNVRVLIRELLAFLEVADNEFKPIMTSQIGIAADRFSPNKRWHIDTMLRVLSLAGNYVKEQILSSFIRLIATTPDLQTYAVQKLYASLKKDITQESLTLAGAWCIGEFGEALLRGGQYEEEELVEVVKEDEVIDLFSLILNSSYATQIATEYIMTSLMKLSTRLSDPAQIDRIRRILLSNTASLDVEVQQRSVEYGNLFGYDAIRKGVLEKMPPPQIKEESRVFGEAAKKPNKTANRKSKTIKSAEQDLLFDLMGDGSMPAGDLSSPQNGSQNNADLLADILGDTPAPTPIAQTQQSNVSSIMDLFDSSGPSRSVSAGPQASNDLFSSMPAPPPQATPPAPTYPCYNKNDLNISLQLQRNAEGVVQVLARFTNSSLHQSFSSVSLQAAVPKTQKLQLNAMSNPELGPGTEATQSMRITGSKGPPLRLRLKISYAHPSAGQVTDQGGTNTKRWSSSVTSVKTVGYVLSVDNMELSVEIFMGMGEQRSNFNGAGAHDSITDNANISAPETIMPPSPDPDTYPSSPDFFKYNGQNPKDSKFVQFYSILIGLWKHTLLLTSQNLQAKRMGDQKNVPDDPEKARRISFVHEFFEELHYQIEVILVVQQKVHDNLLDIVDRLVETFAQQADITHIVLLRKIQFFSPSILILHLCPIETGLRHRHLVFRPGQWVDLLIPSIPKAGGFTITSTPAQLLRSLPRRDLNGKGNEDRELDEDGNAKVERYPFLELAIQKSSNPHAAWLWRPEPEILNKELRVRVGGSFVWPPIFYGDEDGKGVGRVMFVAGGVGVNPLVSMLSYLGEVYGEVEKGEGRGESLAVRFLYSVRDPGGERSSGELEERILFYRRILQAFEGLGIEGILELFLTGGNEEGRLDWELMDGKVRVRERRITGEDLLRVLGTVEERKRTVCYICGVPKMTDEFVNLVKNGEGMDRRHVLSEKWW
ncbi:hypothetical protein B7494_g5881 [Chlorociboria aeruginascens]|nr:hypothetical protein B7494_g5881 [Chlorociboria aeruginascens]